MNQIDRHIGAKLCDRRRRLDRSLEDVAIALGIGVDGVRRLEAGVDRVSAAQIQSLCRILTITPADIYSGVVVGSPS